MSTSLVIIVVIILVLYIAFPEGSELGPGDGRERERVDSSAINGQSRNNGTSFEPQIIAAGENLYAVWTDKATGNGDIYFKRIEDNGGNFSRTYNLE